VVRYLPSGAKYRTTRRISHHSTCVWGGGYVAADVPAESRSSQALVTRAAMPTSASLP
jgi:hypothetical protein